MADLVPSDPTIRHMSLDDHNMTVGELRNLACRYAEGELIAHWDDDDWSAPNRLEVQIAFLRDSGKAVTGFRSIIFSDGASAWLYQYRGRTFAVGTSLVYRKAWWEQHRFMRYQVGEDAHFTRETVSAGGQLAVMDGGNLMWASVHGSNTCPRRDLYKWQPIEKPGWVQWPA